MKKILTLFLLLQSFFSFSQEGFSKIYDFGNTSASFTNIVLDNENIVLSGTTRIDSLNQWGVIFIRLDTMGNILDYKVHLDSLGDWLLTGRGGGLIKLTNGDFVISTNPFFRNSGMMMRLDSLGNIISTNEYVDSVNLTVRQKDIMELNNGFLIGGIKQKPSGQRDTYIIKTDILGNKIWEKSYGTNILNDDFSSFCKKNNNEILIGMGVNSLNNTPFLNWQSQSRIIVIDSMGEILTERLSNINEIEGAAFGLNISTDNSITYLTNFMHTFSNFERADQQKIVRLDSNFNLVWSKIIGQPTDPANILWDLKETPDGDWIATGNETTNPNNSLLQYRGGWIYKFSDLGDSIWNRLDTALWHPTGGSNNYLDASVVLPSGSIISCGEFESSTLSKSFAWLHKVSKNGCLTPDDCALLPVYVPYLTEENFFRVFPNPSSEVLNIYFKNNQKRKKGLFRLVDINGQIVFQSKINSNDLEYSIPLEIYASGIYFLQYIQEGILMKSEKVVIQQ